MNRLAIFPQTGEEGLSVARIEEFRQLNNYLEGRRQKGIVPIKILSEEELRIIFLEGQDFLAIAETLASM